MEGNYNISEIKYNIDTGIQRAMFEILKNDSESEESKHICDALVNAQNYLYEEFGIM